jgi:hypothetical protein
MTGVRNIPQYLRKEANFKKSRIAAIVGATIITQP